MTGSTRFTGHEFSALVAADTFDPIVERIRAILSHPRRMVLISRYARWKGADELDIKVGLRLSDEPDHLGKLEPPIRVSSSTVGKATRRALHVDLKPGRVSFGFSTVHRSEAELHSLYERRAEEGYSPVTRVRVHGWPTPQRDDLIEIEHWNQYGVGALTTVVFQAD